MTNALQMVAVANVVDHRMLGLAMIMKASLRWTSAVLLSLVAFGVTWWLLAHYAKLDSGVAVGVAAVPFTITLTLGGAWAERARKKEKAAPERSTIEVSRVQNSQVSGTAAGANFGSGGDFRNANIFVGNQYRQESSRSHAQENRGAQSKRVISGDIPQKPQAFEERYELQAELINIPESSGRIFVITGIRGVGKSQFAASIARRRIDDGWRLVAWINAEDSSQLIAELCSLANQLGIKSETSDNRDLALGVRHWLESDGDQCLIVLDNAVNADRVRPFLPATGSAQVIVTSYRRTLTNLGKPLTVEIFTPQQAIAFLVMRTGRDDAVGAREVAADLGYLPLALAQAAAVIAGQNIEYATYRERLVATRVAEYLTQTEGDPYPLGVAEAIMLSVAGVESGRRGPMCRPVLELVSILSPSGVPRQLIYLASGLERSKAREGFSVTTYEPIGSAGEIDLALEELANSSLITWSIDGTFVSMHRLVARVIRERASHDATLSTIADRAIDTLYPLIEKDDRKEILPTMEAGDLAAQITALADNLTVAKDIIDAQHSAFLGILVHYGVGFSHGFRHGTARRIAEEGRLDEAIAELEALAEDARRIGIDVTSNALEKIEKDLADLRRRRGAKVNPA